MILKKLMISGMWTRCLFLPFCSIHYFVLNTIIRTAVEIFSWMTESISSTWDILKANLLLGAVRNTAVGSEECCWRCATGNLIFFYLRQIAQRFLQYSAGKWIVLLVWRARSGSSWRKQPDCVCLLFFQLLAMQWHSRKKKPTYFNSATQTDCGALLGKVYSKIFTAILRRNWIDN